LDRKYGKWKGYKLKKETYSFFIAKSLDLLTPRGELCFISSDTFLTISTMSGLRRKLFDLCSNTVTSLSSFSEETSYPMVILYSIKCGTTNSITVDGRKLSGADIGLTDNFSWKIDDELIKYFYGDKLSKYIVCTSGMTVGKNELFVRELDKDGSFIEPYSFAFYEKAITLEEEISKARLGIVSPNKRAQINELERKGTTYRALSVTQLEEPLSLQYPHEDYLPYNKANSSIIYSKPSHVIYWKDDGDAVLTFKKTGNWYLNGVGGQKFFKREGLTWALISSHINIKYLPSGYILDSGAPCAFLREGVDHEELWFIFAWLLTDLATEILKTTINHTMNIQGKDVERLPYPWWVDAKCKRKAIRLTRNCVERAINGEIPPRHSPELKKINSLFQMTDTSDYSTTRPAK
jgi:hypothetical protein